MWTAYMGSLTTQVSWLGLRVDGQWQYDNEVVEKDRKITITVINNCIINNELE